MTMGQNSLPPQAAVPWAPQHLWLKHLLAREQVETWPKEHTSSWMEYHMYIIYIYVYIYIYTCIIFWLKQTVSEHIWLEPPHCIIYIYTRTILTVNRHGSIGRAGRVQSSVHLIQVQMDMVPHFRVFRKQRKTAEFRNNSLSGWWF